MTRERGQASIEWIAAVLLVSVSLGALAAVGPRVDGRSLGSWLAHAIVCAASGDCRSQDDALRAAYGERDAALLRRHAPGLVYEPGTYTLPVDFRSCRRHRCSDAPDDRDLDVHKSRSGRRAAAFTRVVRRGGETFLQYWLYYPDSTTTAANAAGVWRRTLGRAGVAYPGHHPDDWESYQVRIDRRGRAFARASSHNGYQTCKHGRCRNRWMPATGWTRVSRGSHAGHIPVRSRPRGIDAAGWRGVRMRWEDRPAYPGLDLRERTTSAAGLVLIPLERVAARRPRERFEVTPPWRKEVYERPRSNSTGGAG